MESSPFQLQNLRSEESKKKEESFLEVVIQNCKLKTENTGKFAQEEAYFILIQLDEQANMVKPQKYRSDIATILPKSEEIKFQKTVFKFTDCNPFELASIRVACFKVKN